MVAFKDVSNFSASTSFRVKHFTVFRCFYNSQGHWPSSNLAIRISLRTCRFLQLTSVLSRKFTVRNFVLNAELSLAEATCHQNTSIMIGIERSKFTVFVQPMGNVSNCLKLAVGDCDHSLWFACKEVFSNWKSNCFVNRSCKWKPLTRMSWEIDTCRRKRRSWMN